jgi:hypothetical protein
MSNILPNAIWLYEKSELKRRSIWGLSGPFALRIHAAVTWSFPVPPDPACESLAHSRNESAVPLRNPLT